MPGAVSGNRRAVDMPSSNTQEQIWARDDKGMKHAITVTRAPMPGLPHLQGLPRFSWGAGRPLSLIDNKAGILECASTKQRLKIEEWAG